MCTGVEIAMLAGSALSAGAAVKSLGSSKGGAPQVVQSSPLADQAKIDAAASAKAAQDKTQLRRRLRASSLLATGGQGDTLDPVTGQPSAIAGKSTLGA
jgi:hypothetical protein